MPKPASSFAALQVRTGEESSSVRYLYLKPHTAPVEGTGTALFVAGLGVGYDQVVLTELFSVFGSVSQVAVHANKVSITPVHNCNLLCLTSYSCPTDYPCADISPACFQKRR